MQTQPFLNSLLFITHLMMMKMKQIYTLFCLFTPVRLMVRKIRYANLAQSI